MNIAILTGCDSDKHLSEPVFNKLRKLELSPYYIYLKQNNMCESYHIAESSFKHYKYDFVLSVGDRMEQLAGVLAAFHNHIPIGHLYAGDTNTIATFDDVHRHSITLHSDIQFCSSIEAVNNVDNMMYAVGLKSKAFLVGATHLDEICIKDLPFDSLNQSKPYILILINSETLGIDEQLVEEATSYILKNLTHIQNIIIAQGNEDNKAIESTIFKKLKHSPNITINAVIENRKNHLYFLSLIKNCEYFVTNSSAVIYEAPFLLDKDRIIHVGNRNRNRTPVPLSAHDKGASSRIAKLIKSFLEYKV